MGLEPTTLQDIYSTCAPPTSTRTAKLVRWVLAHTTVTVFPSLVTSTVLRPSVDHLTSSDNLFRNSTLNGNAVEPLNNGYIGVDHIERLSSFGGKMYCHYVGWCLRKSPLYRMSFIGVTIMILTIRQSPACMWLLTRNPRTNTQRHQPQFLHLQPNNFIDKIIYTMNILSTVLHV